MKEVLNTESGDMIAVKNVPADLESIESVPWNIRHPWGDEFFYGNAASVRSRMRSIKWINEEEK